MDNIPGVYKIESILFPNRCYIGSTSSLRKRWQMHLAYLKRKSHHAVKLQRHYNKYGESDLIFSVIKCCPCDELIITEQFFIDYYSPYFNSTLTAGRNSGYEHPVDVKEKMSKIRTEYNNRLEVAEKKRKRMKELWADSAYRERVINARLGNKQTQETIDKRVATRKKNGKKATPEMLAKRKGRKLTPEQLERHREIRSSPEYLKKLSESVKKGRANNPKPDIVCEYCGKLCKFTNYHTRHGKRCKKNITH